MNVTPSKWLKLHPRGKPKAEACKHLINSSAYGRNLHCEAASCSGKMSGESTVISELLTSQIQLNNNCHVAPDYVTYLGGRNSLTVNKITAFHQSFASEELHKAKSVSLSSPVASHDAAEDKSGVTFLEERLCFTSFHSATMQLRHYTDIKPKCIKKSE